MNAMQRITAKALADSARLQELVGELCDPTGAGTARYRDGYQRILAWAVLRWGCDAVTVVDTAHEPATTALAA